MKKQFSTNAAQRIVQATHDVEHRMQNEGAHRGRWTSDTTRPQLVELTSALSVGGTAGAKRVKWSATAGDYIVDDSDTLTVSDKRKQHSGSIGDWIEIIPLGSDAGTVFVVVGSVAVSSIVHFELTEVLAKYASAPVKAQPRVFDTAQPGWVTDCDAEHIWVMDLAGTGFSGAVGAVGYGVEKTVDPIEIDGETVTTVIEIHGLQCAADVTESC